MVAALLTLLAVGCATSSSLDGLPVQVGGETLVYNVAHGEEADRWALKVAEELGADSTDVTSATGFTAPGPREYQSYVIKIRGAQGREFMRHVLPAIRGLDPPWKTVDEVVTLQPMTVRGKEVLVFAPPESPTSLHYVYAFGDTVVVIYAVRQQEVAEALDALP